MFVKFYLPLLNKNIMFKERQELYTCYREPLNFGLDFGMPRSQKFRNHSISGCQRRFHEQNCDCGNEQKEIIHTTPRMFIDYNLLEMLPVDITTALINAVVFSRDAATANNVKTAACCRPRDGVGDKNTFRIKDKRTHT